MAPFSVDGPVFAWMAPFSGVCLFGNPLLAAAAWATFLEGPVVEAALNARRGLGSYNRPRGWVKPEAGWGLGPLWGEFALLSCVPRSRVRCPGSPCGLVSFASM